jgi:hypothetical protein
MQYLLLCRFNEEAWAAIPESERARIMDAYWEVLADLDRSGQHVTTGQLQPRAVGRTLRHREGRLTVTDGPFMETKEHLGGYHLIECDSLDDAVTVASRIPTLPAGGTVEVRPLLIA